MTEQDDSMIDEPKNEGGPVPEPQQYASEPLVQAKDSGFQFPLWGKIALLIAAVSLAVIGYIKSGTLQKNADQSDDEQESARTLESRQTVPDLTLVDADGKSQKLSDFKGQVVLVTFWAQWCAPCLVELPTFASLFEKYEKQGFKVLAVNVDEGTVGKDFARDLWKQKNFKYLSFFDEAKASAEEFGVEVLPANFVIDRKGLLAFSGFGANDWSTPETAEMIESLLGETP